jgi:mRNA-degrading endonuclease RelE of RelBE toxin-antitoxin system
MSEPFKIVFENAADNDLKKLDKPVVAQVSKRLE